MREHPIPQDITGYRFHIIGSMTLKQFGEILFGIILAFIIYKTNLLFPIKWLLIAASVGIGVAAAFVPIEERPLDHWIITFFKILYKPTQFFWRKTAKIPSFFEYVADPNITNQGPDIDLSPIRRDRISQYLRSVNKINPSQAEDANELLRIQEIIETFKTQPATATATQKHIEQKPELGVRVRKMRSDTALPPAQLKQEVTVFAAETQRTELEAANRDFSQTKKSILSTDQVGQNVEVPEFNPIVIDVSRSPEEDMVADNARVDASQRAYIENTAPEVANNTSTNQSVSFNTDLPFPFPPDIPNKIVGMVLSQQGELISEAIVEIHSQDGTIERAVKTNALGQFFVTTPLANGEFTLITEKDGYTFEPRQLTLSGALVPPVEVRSI